MRDVLTPGGSIEKRGVLLRESDAPLVFALRRELSWLDERWRTLWSCPDAC